MLVQLENKQMSPTGVDNSINDAVTYSFAFGLIDLNTKLNTYLLVVHIIKQENGDLVNSKSILPYLELQRRK